MSKFDIPWPHAPTHKLCDSGTFLVTAGTYQKINHFNTSTRLDLLQRGLLKLAAKYQWHLEAWAVFSNHYHFIGHSPPDSAASLKMMLSELHTKSASYINQQDRTPRRKVWHNFWETRLSYEKSYLARLHYVHANPVKHGLSPIANQYRWGSAAWFERTASPAQVRTIYSFKTELIETLDDYVPAFPINSQS
jgi:putative transposase